MAQDPPPRSEVVPRLLHEDDRLVAVDKPWGWLVHNSAYAGPKEHTLTDWVREGYPDAVPLHRLDRGASGVVAFARGKVVAGALSARLDVADKRYWALVRGALPEPIDLDHPVSIDGVRKDARTAFSPVASCAEPRVGLVEARLFSGRRHQIRRHAKHLSHPLVGDVKYGKGPLNRLFRERYGFARLGLHAHRLVVDGETIRAPLPEHFASVVAELFGEAVLGRGQP